MAKSLSRLMLQVNGVRIINFLKFLPSLWKKIRVWFVCINQNFDDSIKEILQTTDHIEYLTCGMFWALAIQDKLKDSNTPAIKYEDIVSCPEASIRAIFNYCGLSEKLVPKAVKTLFGGDSQHNLALSWEELVQMKWCNGDTSSKSRRARDEMDAICRHFGVPELSEDCILPNTLTVGPMDNNNYL